MRQLLRHVLANVQRAWYRSLQVRVVTITLATSSALVVAFGLIMGTSITHGLLDKKHAESKAQVKAGTEYAKSQLAAVTSRRDPRLNEAAQAIVAELSNRSAAARAAVAILRTDADMRLREQSASSVVAQRDAHERVPAALRQAVNEHGFAWQRLNLDLGAGNQLYLVFGQQVRFSWGAVDIYYFFPLNREVDMAGLVANSIVGTGAALVLMLAIVAALVTRMVVQPVRIAARTAQRLSNGLLDQRMKVVGEDDLAKLAASFNQMAENLQRHIQRLEEMSRLQRRFTSDVSHELRTPLTTVRMAADLIFNSRSSFPPPVARSAELLQTELDRFESLLAELLEISRFDAGFASLDAEPANIGTIVQRSVERLSAVAERAGVTIEVDLPREPVVAEVDMRRVERILRNLIGNAIEYGEGKPVTVRLRANDHAVAITVRDRGVGLKPGEEKLVFNRFWRADPSRARKTGGTGLGLSISLEDARLHGGWLEAWGAPGQGAQFRLTLPIRAGEVLSSSPLRLVPADTHQPAAVDGAVAPAQRSTADDSADGVKPESVQPTMTVVESESVDA